MISAAFLLCAEHQRVRRYDQNAQHAYGEWDALANVIRQYAAQYAEQRDRHKYMRFSLLVERDVLCDECANPALNLRKKRGGTYLLE